MQADDGAPDGAGSMRLDKWLWAARFFKTRSAAATAVDGGKIDVGDERAKRARQIRVGDRVTIRRPPFEQHVMVRGLNDLRGPASEATKLWEETAESRATRDKLAFQLKNAPTLTFMGGGRPTKRDRREIEKMKQRS